jgi:hypothetical protein
MDAVPKITVPYLENNGYVPHRLNDAVYLYEKEGLIIEIIPLINLVNIRVESKTGGYPRLLKQGIKSLEELEEYIRKHSRPK